MIDIAQMGATEERYRDRAEVRGRRRQRTTGRGALQLDEPERIAKRLARLGANTTSGTEVAGPAEAVTADIAVLERLIGTNDLIGAGFLMKGASAARSVARVVIRTKPDLVAGFGTGFLAAPGLLVTNNHVLEDARTAHHSEAEFDYQLGPDGTVGPAVAFPLQPDVFFVTDPALDFTVVAVAPEMGGRNLDEFGWNPLIEAEGKVILSEPLNIVQHPNGEPKQLALRENRLVDLIEDFLHYETDTAPGSSGSPVFNEQWEVVGVHHSGVPRRDSQGRILARSGEPWTPAMGEAAIDWVANEGVRVSRICRHLRALPLSGSQAEQRDELLASPLPPERVTTSAPSSSQVAAAIQVHRTPASPEFTVTVPLEITVRVGSSAAAGPPAVPPVVTGPPPPESQELRDALVRLAEARRRPYYDEAGDGEARDAYYAGISGRTRGKALFQALAELVATTHHTEPRYKPHVEVYPDVDLQPDGQLRSIYTGEVFAPERLIVEDVRTEHRRTEVAQRQLAEAALDPDALVALEEELEASFPFNCEHVVPQSWFDKAEPMRGDLHHLFTCQSQCNSFRGNTPFFDFSDFEEVIRERCGRREEHRFEPNAGKGEAARATFYFLVRYPGLVNKTMRELEKDRLKVLMAWHEAFPVTVYERHRNARIHERQGNRNPFVDRPEWARKTALTLGLG